MLEELKGINYNGGKEGLVFFLCDVVGRNNINIRDAGVICSHATGKRHLAIHDIVNYCRIFGWVCTDSNVISLCPSLSTYIVNKDALNKKLILSTVDQLFAGEVLNATMFSYDNLRACYLFKNELLPLSFSSVRNVLISQGFLVAVRSEQGTRFYIATEYEALVAKHCKTSRTLLSLEKLKKQLVENELAGEKAELFVLSFEKKRIGDISGKHIRRISEIDASAGYDIVSFNSNKSLITDRFIEVKAVSSSGFFWSRNEYEMAKLKGDLYYLYLVDLNRINEPNYTPVMIQNPAVTIMKNDGWFVETQTFHIIRI